MPLTGKQKAFIMSLSMTAGIMSLFIFAVLSSEPLRLSILSIINEDKPVIEQGDTLVTAGDIFYLVPTGVGVFAGSMTISNLIFVKKI